MEQTFLNSERFIFYSFPKSSNLAFSKFDTLNNILEITFQNGSRYQYFGVSLDIYNELSSSNSAGIYFNSVIKKFRCEKVK